MIELSQHRGFEVMLTNDPALARAAAAAAKPANSKTEIIAKIDVVASLFPEKQSCWKGRDLLSALAKHQTGYRAAELAQD